MVLTGTWVSWNYPEMGTPTQLRTCFSPGCISKAEALLRVSPDLVVSPEFSKVFVVARCSPVQRIIWIQQLLVFRLKHDNVRFEHDFGELCYIYNVHQSLQQRHE